MINSYRTDPVVVSRWNGNDTRGEEYPRTEIRVRAYVEWKTRLIRNLKGEEVETRITVHLPMRRTDAAVGRALRHEDRIIVDGADRTIIGIDEPKAFDHAHYRVYLGQPENRV